MDRDQRVGDFGAQAPLDGVADIVRGGDGHAAGHDEMEIDERRPARLARPEIMRLDRAGSVVRDRLADALQELVGYRLVHEAADRLTDESPSRPENVERDEPGEEGVEDGKASDRRQG